MIRPTSLAPLLLMASLAHAADPPYDGSIARGGPARTGDLGAIKLPEKGELLWRVDIENGAGACVVADGVVYLAGGQSSLFAVKADGSAILWQEDRPGRVAYNSPLVVGDRVYLASSLGLSAHVRMTGKRLWLYPIEGGAMTSSALLIGGKVVIAGADGFVHAVDPITGAVGWRHEIGKDAAAVGEAREADPSQLMSMASDGSTVFVPIMSQSRVVAIDASDGKPRWSFRAGDSIQGLPTVTGDDLLVTSHDKKLYCLDRATGKPRWDFPTGGPITAGVGVRDGSAYFGSGDGVFYRVDLKTGKKVWSFETPRKPDGSAYPIASSPLIDADAVCFGSLDGFLYAVKLDTGALKWKVKAAEGSEIASSPITDGRFLFISVRPDLGNGTYSLVAIGVLPEGRPVKGRE